MYKKSKKGEEKMALVKIALCNGTIQINMKNQERYAFLGGVVTEEMKKSRKGSLKVRVIEDYPKRKVCKVRILETGQILNISRYCVI
jgi:hypothetical protein